MNDGQRAVRRRHCVFTSAGDRNIVRSWLAEDGRRSFDLFVAYYDDDDRVFAELSDNADACVRIKGGKYQNLWSLARSGALRLDDYDYVWVADDDMRIAPAAIEACFRLAQHFGFWVSSPAHDPRGKVSNPFMVQEEGDHDIRIVSYIEVTWPIFRSDMLRRFLDAFDGSLTCWGVDHWWSHVFGTERNFRSAIFDCIPAINTPDELKGGRREIGRLVTDARLIEAYQAARGRHGFAGVRPRTMARIALEWDMRLTLLGEQRPLRRLGDRIAPRDPGEETDNAPGAALAREAARFSAEEIALLRSELSQARTVSVFGAPWLAEEAAAGPALQLVFVDSRGDLLRQAAKGVAARAALAGGRLRLLHRDLGEVRPNGQPLSRGTMGAWRHYPAAPWPEWETFGEGPDLVLALGNFRKASCVQALIHWSRLAHPAPLRIVLHNVTGPDFDFLDDLSAFFGCVGRAGQLVVLQPEPMRTDRAIHLGFLLQRWLQDSR